MSTQPAPSGPPFGPFPGATQSGSPVPQQNWPLFSVRGAAAELIPQYIAAAEKAGCAIVAPFALQDGIYGAAPSYYSFAVAPQPSGSLEDVSIFVVTGTVKDAQGNIEIIADVAGSLIKRSLQPDMAQGDSNYTQQGHGASTINVPAGGILTLSLYPTEGYGAAHWSLS